MHAFCRCAVSTTLTGLLANGVCADDLLASREHGQSGERRLSRITVERLIQLRDIAGHAGTLFVSPDQRHVAFVLQQADLAANDYRSGLYVLGLSTIGRPKYLVPAGPIRLGGSSGRTAGYVREPVIRWSPDSEWIGYFGAGGSSEIRRIRADGTADQQIVRSDHEIMDFYWHGSASDVIYQTGWDLRARAASDATEAARGYLLDERFWPDYASHPLWPECGNTDASNTSQSLWQCRNVLRIINLEAQKQVRASAEDARLWHKASRSELAPVSDAGRPANKRVSGPVSAWIENANPARYLGLFPPRVVSVSFKTPNGADESLKCDKAECTGAIQDVWILDAPVRIVFLRAEGHADSDTALYEWRPRSGATRLLMRTQASVSACEQSFERLVCIHESPTQPRSIVSVDMITGRLHTLFEPNAELHAIRFTRVEKLEWHDAFGNPAFGHLVYPGRYGADRKFPLVIVQYRSRGFLRGGVGNEYPIHLFAAHDFFVLSFDAPRDIRNRTILPKDQYESSEWDQFYERRRSFTALERILGELLERGEIDPQRIGITGLSDGAETVGFTLIHSDRYAAAIASSAIWHPALYSITNSSFREYIRRNVAAPDDMSKWRSISLGLNARRINTPLLLHIADHEFVPTVPNVFALQDAKAPVEAYVFSGEYHNKWQPVHRYNIYRRNLQWMQYWLQDMENARPVDEHQYARWALLRQIRERRQKSLSTAADFNQ